jgi:hypothetical protein
MGIATALVRSWESGSSQPNDQQLKVLAKILGFDPANEDGFMPPICLHGPEKVPVACRTGIEAQLV